MERFMHILTLVLQTVTAYTALIAVFCCLPPKKKKAAPPNTRFAVLIPARNEEAVIPNILESLRQQNYPRDKFRVFVIPNNCTDSTELAARMAGADILTCQEPVTCKGDVLHQIFAQLMGKYDAYCIFDADNLVHPDFLARMNDAVAGGALCAKGGQIASNPCDSWVSGCYGIYFQTLAMLYNRPRAALGLNAMLVGTGFMVTDTLLCRLDGWNTVTMTEDMEFSAQCAEAGVRVHYVPEAITFDEQPTSFRLSLRQRRRWSAGVLDTANRYIPKLLAKSPAWLRLDTVMTLVLVYVQFLSIFPAVYLLWEMSFSEFLRTGLLILAGFWAGTSALAFFLTLSAQQKPRTVWRSILMYPLFLASWYPLNILAVFIRPRQWQPIVHKGSEHGNSAICSDKL